MAGAGCGDLGGQVRLDPPRPEGHAGHDGIIVEIVAGIGSCQTNSNRSQLGQYACQLSGAKPAPLGQSSSAVDLEEGSPREAAFLVEVVVD